MKKGNISEVTNSRGSGRYKVPLTLAPQDWKMDSMGPFTEPVSHFISPSNAYDSYDGDMEMNKKTISKNEKMAKKARKIADQNFQQNDVGGNPINGFNPKGVTEPGTPDYIKKQANLPKKDYQEVLKEDLAVWFGTKKKPKGSKQPKGPWVNICRKDKNGKHPPCGRSEASDKAYPKCRAAGVAGKMSDSEKRAACVQKRKAEKKDPKIGTGNKPTMTSYKPKNEGLKEIIKSKLNEFLTEQQTPNLQQRYGFDTQTAPSDYLGRQGDVGKRYAELEKMDLLKKQSEEKIQKLRQEFSCLPSLNQQNKPIDPKLRDSLLLTLKWIKDNEDRATQIFGISKDTLYYLFKLAMTAAHTHSDWGTAPDETRNRKIASLVDTVLGEIGDWIFKGVKGKSPSTGLYQMQAPVYRSMKGTHQLTGKKNIENIWESQITSTLAAMEYFLTLYRQAQSSAKSGPSVTRDGKALVQSTGDHAWDIAITGYQWPVEDLIKKYCKTKNQDGSYNTDYLGPCDKKQVQPFRTEDEAKRAGKKYAGILNVQQNEPVQNFLPEKFVSGTQYSTYDLLNTTKRLIKQMSCF